MDTLLARKLLSKLFTRPLFYQVFASNSLILWSRLGLLKKAAWTFQRRKVDPISHVEKKTFLKSTFFQAKKIRIEETFHIRHSGEKVSKSQNQT